MCSINDDDDDDDDNDDPCHKLAEIECRLERNVDFLP